MAKDFHKQTTIPGVVKKKLPLGPPPKNIAGFKIESLLEKGGMSIVYLATREETSELITLKILSPEFIDNEEVIARFLKESNIIAMADHPNIVKLYTQGKWEGGLYIAMEYIPGISLHELLKTTQLSLKKSLEITLEVAYALCHLHSFGVIHRDLKLENILLTKDGQVKVIDFGIAQIITEKSSSGGNKKRIIGTPVYMSPEQRVDPESVTYSSDIYSLGIIIYELVLGRLSNGKVHLSLIPSKLQPILSKCLAPNPLERYQDVVDLIAELSLFMNEENSNENRQPVEILEEVFAELSDARESFIECANVPFQFDVHETTNSSGYIVKAFDNTLIVAKGEGDGVKGIINSHRINSIVNSIKDDDPILYLGEAAKTQNISFEYSVLLLDEKTLHFYTTGSHVLLTVSDEKVKSYNLNKKISLENVDTILFSTLSPEIFHDRGIDIEDELLQASLSKQENLTNYLTKKILAQKRLPSFLLVKTLR